MLLQINLVKYSLRQYTYQNKIRLLSNAFIREPIEVSNKKDNLIIKNKIRLISNAFIRGPQEDSDKKDNFILKKLTELNDWYIKFTGLDEIKRLQDRVILTQEKLEKAQEERREIQKILADVRKKSSELQEQLHNTKRWEDVQKYLDLTRQETEVIKQERELTAQFEMLDKAEREIFTTLSNAVRDSHEKEKAQSEYTKYWGIILSIIGTIVGAVISTLISTIRNHQIVSGINRGVEQKFNQMAGVIKEGGTEKLNIQTIVKEIKNDNDKSSKLILQKIIDSNKRLDSLITNSNNQTAMIVKNNITNIDAFLKAQNVLLRNHQNEIKNIIASRSIAVIDGQPNWLFISGLLLAGLILGKICS